MTFTSPSRRAVAYDFQVTSVDDSFGVWFDELMGSLPPVGPADGGAPAEWRVGREDELWTFHVGDERYGASGDPEELAAIMLQKLNAQVVESWAGSVGHAGCVARDGVAVVLPADPGSGKSTLTCGLVRAGFDYVTDEGVAFVPGTARIEPYPKPLSLDPGSWFLFPELEPRWPFPDGAKDRQHWPIVPDSIRSGAASGPCEARYLVFPRYTAGAATALAPLGRAEALMEIAKNTFGFNRDSRAHLDRLAAVVRACECHRLTVGDLDDAVACIEELFTRG